MSLPAPATDELLALLERCTTFAPPPLVPEVRVFHARSLVEVWEAAEAIAGCPVPSPFWAYAWPAGIALARVLLDQPELARGRRVLDFGAGGGVASLAASLAGARRVVANDLDSWAAAVARLAAERQGLLVETRVGDLTGDLEFVSGFDVVLASDLSYERRTAPMQRALLDRAFAGGAEVLIADAGRTYFEASGLEEIAEYEIEVPRDLEGVDSRWARVYRMSRV
ncbi:MAG: class I SAM-dependent methyltransferase [Longimicrobiales bacterium]